MIIADLLTYLFQLLLISSLGLLAYALLLRQATQLTWNRLLLLGISVGAVLFPWLRLPLASPWQAGKIGEVMLEPVLIQAETTVSQPLAALDSWVFGLYGLISLLLLVRWVWRLLRLWQFQRSCGPARDLQGVIVYYTQGRLGACSFGPWLFWDETLPLAEGEVRQILAHERCHQQQGHSYDLIWTDLLLVLFWWNPALYLLRSCMVANHEALADQAALQAGNARDYRHLLLRQWLRPRRALTHTFWFSHLKHRIHMITTFSHPNQSRWRYWLAVPVFLTLVYVGVCDAQTKITVLIETDEPVRETVVGYPSNQTTPRPSPGLRSNDIDEAPVALNLDDVKMLIGYPQEARDAGEQGLVLARVLVDEQGNYLSHEMMYSESDLLEAAVAEQIGQLRFEPGRKDGQVVRFSVVVPFNFKLLN